MVFFVEVIGSYDAVRVGPFATREAAQQHADTVPSNFTANVMTADKSAASDAKYGALPVQSPERS